MTDAYYVDDKTYALVFRLADAEDIAHGIRLGAAMVHDERIKAALEALALNFADSGPGDLNIALGC